MSDRYYIENVDAFAITRIGGMRIFQSNPIREGDVITLGRSVEFVIKQL